MKKWWVPVLFVFFLCPVSSSYGLDDAGRGFYVAVGGSYAFEDLDVEYDLYDEDGQPMAGGGDVDLDDTWGLSLKAGYHVNDWLSVEFAFDYLSEFDGDDRRDVDGDPLDLDAELDVMTYMGVLKFTCPLEPLKPFIVAGGGLMDADPDVTASWRGASDSSSESDTGACAKLGLGVDYFWTQSFAIALEGSYVWGFGDVDEIQYFIVTAGLGYHF